MKPIPRRFDRREFIYGSLATGMLFPMVGNAAEETVAIDLRYSPGRAVLNDALTDPNFWAKASVSKYKNKLHDEVRLKSMKKGYLTYVSGCGDTDFELETVAKSIFWHQNKLPNHMLGAVACTLLGHGEDPVVKKPYTDTFLLGDFDFFYATYFQRMYYFELPDGRLVCPFELIKADFVEPEVWEQYQKTKADLIESTKAKRRSWMFSTILDVDTFYGMYVVSPGDVHKSRVTMIARLKFGKGSWLADFGSEIPFVLRAGLQSGFRAHVEIVKKVKAGAYTR